MLHYKQERVLLQWQATFYEMEKRKFAAAVSWFSEDENESIWTNSFTCYLFEGSISTHIALDRKHRKQKGMKEAI